MAGDSIVPTERKKRGCSLIETVQKNRNLASEMPAEPQPTHKPCEKPAPYQRQPKVLVRKDAPRTAAKPAQTTQRENLTGYDWMTVYAYVDEHPRVSQGEIVRHFASKTDGALIFTQSTLSRKLKLHPELEKRVASYPNALSSKHARIVTRPDVERALILWVKHMEEKGETVNGPMLKAKRSKFEEQFDVPELERLPGDGWILPFCKAYGLKEHRRHGEAGSVDLQAVEEERKRLGMTLATYPPKNQWNIDESSLFVL